MKTRLVQLGILIILLGCKKKEVEPTVKPEGDASLTIDEFVKKAPTPIQPAIAEDTKVGETVIDKPSGYNCTTTKVAKSFEYNEQIIMNPQSDVVYRAH